MHERAFKVADNRMFASMSEDGRTVLLTVKLTAEERGVERLLVRGLGGDPPVAAHVAGAADVREQVRNLALLGGQLDRQQHRAPVLRHRGEHAVVRDLEDRVTPRLVLVRLRKRERQLADAVGERHVLILSVAHPNRVRGRVRLDEPDELAASSRTSRTAPRGSRSNGSTTTVAFSPARSQRHVPETAPSTRKVANDCGFLVLKMRSR